VNSSAGARPLRIQTAASKLKQEYSSKSDARDAFKLYISQTKNQVESELAKLVSRLSKFNLHPQIEYAVLSGGKRLRPLLTILSAENVGGDRNNVMPLALAFELMHTATLVHDDIIDGDEFRRGIPALYKKWSVRDAILAGDAMIALAVYSASDFGEQILKTVSQSALELCEGEQIDASFSISTATETEYFARIRKKSAALFRAATFCGAVAGGGSQSEVNFLAMFGENFGMAYQLRDDLLDLTPAEGFVPRDLKSGRVTLPLIHLYEMSSHKERERLEHDLQTIMEKRGDMDKSAIERILQSLAVSGSLKHCEKKVDEYVRRSINSLVALRETRFKTYLIQMVESLIV